MTIKWRLIREQNKGGPLHLAMTNSDAERLAWRRTGLHTDYSAYSVLVLWWVLLSSFFLPLVACQILPLRSAGADALRGVPGSPPNGASLAGRYYRGDGMGYNVELDLNADGTYSAKWHGCLGEYGQASGTWNILSDRLAFEPRGESGSMQDHLRTLQVLRYGEGWILVPTTKSERESYDMNGVTRSSCFQRAN